MLLSEPREGECEADYVQFGRDILFITSHRSTKFCGSVEGSLLLPTLPAANTTNTTQPNVTPLGEAALQSIRPEKLMFPFYLGDTTNLLKSPCLSVGS